MVHGDLRYKGKNKKTNLKAGPKAGSARAGPFSAVGRKRDNQRGGGLRAAEAQRGAPVAVYPVE